MKAVALLLIVVTGMVGVAAHGSAASPIPASSAAFAQCFGHGDGGACRTMALPLVADLPEGRDYAELSSDSGWSFSGSWGDDGYSDGGTGGEPIPEFWQDLARAMVRAGFNFVAAEAVRFFVDRLFGGGRLPIELDEQVASHAFDPAW